MSFFSTHIIAKEQVPGAKSSSITVVTIRSEAVILAGEKGVLNLSGNKGVLTLQGEKGEVELD